ncbi:MAG: helix-turn-helix transcriptional regulator, partial [Erysipelotrichaceae bacterium]|nr:helix-turn-helix transcriptional regulator [Erysipelotrichaceae bacterium]
MFSENLRYLRKQAQHSQEYLAKQLNYKSFTTIQKWEDGTSKPSYAVIAKIANIYNVSVNDMMEKDLTIQIPTVPILG